MKEILVLAPSDARYGFALTGVRQREVAIDETWRVLREAIAEPRLGVIIVDARLLARIEPQRLQELTARWDGLLVTLPAPADGTRPQSDELQRLVRRALGYHVKLEP